MTHVMCLILISIEPIKIRTRAKDKTKILDVGQQIGGKNLILKEGKKIIFSY